ncbi:MAG TPA: hypothetical protein DCO79_14160, partial [Spirochaeta sp.]|nr:hypothetical protein [Spirochaeta sp.]
ISGILENDIDYLIKNFLGLLLLPVELAIAEKIFSAQELIERFGSLQSENLPERVYDSYATGLTFDSVKNDPDRIIKSIEKAGGTTRKKEPSFFLEFVRNPGTMQKRLTGMMDEFYTTAVQPFEDDVRQMMEEQIAREQMLLDADPGRFFMDFFRTTYSEIESEPEIFISYYNEIDVIQLDDPQSIIYGKSRGQLKDAVDIPLEQIYSLLADESRRQILQKLCRKPWFIRELADELELTSATVSYHMSRLYTLDLVSNQQGERKRTYYTADKVKVGKMLKAVEIDILG